jgi:hypothetical protein
VCLLLVQLDRRPVANSQANSNIYCTIAYIQSSAGEILDRQIVDPFLRLTHNGIMTLLQGKGWTYAVLVGVGVDVVFLAIAYHPVNLNSAT